MSSESDL